MENNSRWHVPKVAHVKEIVGSQKHSLNNMNIDKQLFLFCLFSISISDKAGSHICGSNESVSLCVCLHVCRCDMLLSLNYWPFRPLSQQLLWLELWQKFSHSPPALKWHLPVCHPCFRWVWKTGEVTHSHSHLYSPSLLRSFLYGHVWRSCQKRVNMGLRSLWISLKCCVVFVCCLSSLVWLTRQDLCVWLWCQISGWPLQSTAMQRSQSHHWLCHKFVSMKLLRVYQEISASESSITRHN